MARVTIEGEPSEVERIARLLGSRGFGTSATIEAAAPRVICLDTETTGLDPAEDEILTLSIVDWDGNCLLDGRYRPTRKTEWPEAEAINGISPASVAECPTIDQEWGRIDAIIAHANEVIAYNATFDLSFLEAAGHPLPKGARVTDAMMTYAEAYGEWDECHDGWRWHKLVEAAADIGYEWTGAAHGSMADALATLAVQKWVENQ